MLEHLSKYNKGLTKHLTGIHKMCFEDMSLQCIIISLNYQYTASVLKPLNIKEPETILS